MSIQNVIFLNTDYGLKPYFNLGFGYVGLYTIEFNWVKWVNSFYRLFGILLKQVQCLEFMVMLESVELRTRMQTKNCSAEIWVLDKEG